MTFNINLIDIMPAGLFEMVLGEADENVARADLVEGKYIARLEPRTLDDIRALGYNDAADERRFDTVTRVSDINQGLYRLCLQPFLKPFVTQASAKFMREIHPNRVWPFAPIPIAILSWLQLQPKQKRSGLTAITLSKTTHSSHSKR